MEAAAALLPGEPVVIIALPVGAAATVSQEAATVEWVEDAISGGGAQTDTGHAQPPVVHSRPSKNGPCLVLYVALNVVGLLLLLSRQISSSHNARW